MEVSGEEDELVQLLKNNCFPNGREEFPTKSVEIFHGLGKIYRQKSPDKISLIQSAALFNAAIVRDPNAELVKQSLEELCGHTLELSKAEKKVNLLNLAIDFRNEIHEFRRKVKKDLHNLKNMQESLTAGERHKFESQRINDMQVIQENISATFRDIMKRIAERCVEALGKPPCQYALVGMGSLAKREVTPYSDFECIIILEDQPETNIATNVEYFRWFAVVFQMILINFGETLVPCVAVPTLNNAYNNDPAVKKKYRWFYDAYTPSGISFDGMVPFACKSPLGRQQHTDAKPWKTELIRTVSDMLEYLSRDEDLKNGYHIADMLTKTCFVQGDESIYGRFYDGVCLQLEAFTKSDGSLKDDYISAVVNEFGEDYEKFSLIRSFVKVRLATKIDIKKFVFRTHTLVVGSLGRYHGVSHISCCGIIDQLVEKQILQLPDAHRIKYALAVSSELRQKIYCERSKQRDDCDRTGRDFLLQMDGEETTAHFEKLVGKPSLVECLKTGLILQEVAAAHIYSNKPLSIQDHLPIIPLDLCVLDMLGTSESEMKTLVKEKYMDSNGDLRFTGDFKADTLLQGYVSQLFPELSEQLASKISTRHEADNTGPKECFTSQWYSYVSAAMPCLTRKQYGKCYEMLQKSFQAIEADKNDSELHIDVQVAISGMLHLCLKEMGAPLEALEVTERILRMMKLNCIVPEQYRYVTLEARSELLYDLKLTEEAIECLNQCVEWRERVAADPGSDSYWCQYQFKLYYIFLHTKRPEKWVKHALQVVTGNITDNFVGGDLLLYVYATASFYKGLLNQPQKSVEFCRMYKLQLYACFAKGEVPVHSPRVKQNLGVLTDPNEDFDNYTYGSFLNLYGECLFQLQEYEDSLKILQEAKEQFEKEPFANSKHVLQTKVLIRDCVVHILQKRPFKACIKPNELQSTTNWRPYFEKHLKSFSEISTMMAQTSSLMSGNPSFIKELHHSIKSNSTRAVSINSIEDLVQEKKYTKAYRKVMETRMLFHVGSDIDSKLLLTLARCYREFDRYHDAIAVCMRAIEIRQGIAKNPCTDKMLCDLITLLNDSHRQLGCSPVKTRFHSPLVSVHAYNLLIKERIKNEVTLPIQETVVKGFESGMLKIADALFEEIVDFPSRKETTSITTIYGILYSANVALKLMDYNKAREKADELKNELAKGYIRSDISKRIWMIFAGFKILLNELPAVKGSKIDDRDHNCELNANERFLKMRNKEDGNLTQGEEGQEAMAQTPNFEVKK